MTAETVPPRLPGVPRPFAGPPNCLGDKANRIAAGVPAFVAELRFSGVFLPARLLHRRAIPQGLLVSTHQASGWGTSLHPLDGDIWPLLNNLSRARVVRQRADGVMLLGGVQWDAGYLQRWPQTWLCAPSEAAAISAIDHLQPWLDGRYTGTY